MQCDGQGDIYNFRALMRIAGPLVRIAVRTFWTRDRDRKAHIARKGSPSLPFSSQHLMGRHGAVHAALNELSPRTAEKPFRGTSASSVQSPFRACAGGGVGLHWLGPFPLGCTLSSHSGYLSNIQVTRPSIQGKRGGVAVGPSLRFSVCSGRTGAGSTREAFSTRLSRPPRPLLLSGLPSPFALHNRTERAVLGHRWQTEIGSIKQNKTKTEGRGVTASDQGST